MLVLRIEDSEMYDNRRNEFIPIRGGTFTFEHTLKNLAEWESDFKKPFHNADITQEDLMWYALYMCDDPELTMAHLTAEVMGDIEAYIEEERTATVFSSARSSKKGKGSVVGQVVTSEYIYYLMITAGIPFEAENWHLSRLTTLLQIFSVKNNPDNKMTTDDIYKQNKQLNEERRKKYNTKG